MNQLALNTRPTRSRRIHELLGLLLLLLSVLLLLALISYRASDPSLNTAGATAVHNWTGRLGASTSDLLLQLEGAAAFALPLLLGVLGIGSIRSHSPAKTMLWVKLAGLLLAVLVAPALFALLPGHLQIFHTIPVGGVTGTLLLDSLVSYVNTPGACVILLFLAAVALYLLTTFSVLNIRGWLLVRFAFLASWRDRWANWRLRRAHRKAQQREARTLLTQQRALDEQNLLTELNETNGDLGQSIDGQHQFPAGAALPNFQASTNQSTRRNGGFAESQGDTRTMGTAWDEDEFSTLNEAPPAVTAPRPHLVPNPAQAPSSQHTSQHKVQVWEEAQSATPPNSQHRVQVWEEAQSTTPPTSQHKVQVWEEAPGATLPTRPQPPATGTSIAFTARADANQRPVTMTARSVPGYESVYKLPPTTLLHRSEESHEVRQETLRAEAQLVVEKCSEFGVGGQVTQINPGPVVTTFEFRPDAGVKYSRITGLSDDLALAMAAESILIERMAGKSTVGIQVPNAERETIWLRDIIESEHFAHSKSKITMAMGKDINGRTVVADLATMPHVLIAGSTGSGKSVAINAMIMSVLYKATPEQVRLILVDPKRVELGMYEGIPHLFTPIITEPKLAANALKNAVREMERRLKLLASRSVRNLDQYNRLFDTEPTLWDEQGVEEKPLPYIMIIIDELADLMILDKSNVEEAITRLAQMARAVGIHLVLATQRPSVDVITGLIKANVPTRMSFRLSTKVDSRTILDANGAESLLGRGDMLFLPPGTSRLQRVHAPFVTETEISGVVAFWKAQGEAQYVEAFLESPKDANGRDLDGEGSSTPGEENDPLFDDAVRLVFEFGKASTSLLQRRMRIGYGRAAHLIDLMERDGLVGPPEGSKPRELLKPATWLNESDEALR